MAEKTWKARGGYRTIGWDIMTLWALDEYGVLFMNDGHGGVPDFATTYDHLLEDIVLTADRNALAVALGRELPPPWMDPASEKDWALARKETT